MDSEDSNGHDPLYHDDGNDNNEDISSDLEHELLDDKGKDEDVNTALHTTPTDGSPKPENITINVNLTSKGQQISLDRRTQSDVVKGKTCSNIAAEQEGDEKAKSSSAVTVKEQSTKKSENTFDKKDSKDKGCMEGTSGNEAKEKTDGKETTRNKPKEITSGNEPTEQTAENDGKKEASKTGGKSMDVLGKSPKQKRKRSNSCNSLCSSDCSACNRMGSSSSSSTGSSTSPAKKKKAVVQDESDEFSSNPEKDDMGSDEEETSSTKKQQITPPKTPSQRPGSDLSN